MTDTLTFVLDPAPEGGPPASPVRMAVDDPSLADAARAFFPDYRMDGVEAGSGRTDSEPVLEVRRSGDGWLVRDREGRTTEAGRVGRAASLLEMALAEALVRSAGPRWLGLHASGAVPGPGAILLSGPGGSGKSTLAAALAQEGAPLLGEDVVFLDRENGRVHPFKRLVKLDVQGRRVLGLAAPPGPRGETWPGVALFTPGELGSGWAPAAPVRELVFPRRVSGSGPATFRPLSPADAVRRLLGQVVLVDRISAGDFGALADAFAGARFREMRFEESREAAGRLLEEWTGPGGASGGPGSGP